MPLVPVRSPRSGWTRHGRLVRGLLALMAAAAIGSALVLAVSYGGESGRITPVHNRVPGVRLAAVIPGTPAISTADLQRQAVIVNFWASWCGPCEHEMPAFQAAHNEFRNRIVFIGIDESDTRARAIAFLHRLGVTYANGFDGNATVGQAFAIPGTPSTYFISHGRELDVRFGPLSAAVLGGAIQQLFGL